MREKDPSIMDQIKQILADCKKSAQSFSLDPKSDLAEILLRYLLLQEIDRQGYSDSVLDLLYDSVDEMLLRNKLSELDNVLEQLIPDHFSLDLLLGILTATLPAKSRLPSRGKLRYRVAEIAKKRGEFEENLLIGL